MPKLNIPLLTICAMTGDGHLPFIECLANVLKLDLPAKTGYWLEKVRKVAVAEFQDFNTKRIELFKKFGKEEGGLLTIAANSPDLEEFQKEISSLNHPVELPLDEGFKLTLPKSYVPEDWRPLTDALDIFQPPEE